MTFVSQTNPASPRAAGNYYNNLLNTGAQAPSLSVFKAMMAKENTCSPIMNEQLFKLFCTLPSTSSNIYIPEENQETPATSEGGVCSSSEACSRVMDSARSSIGMDNKDGKFSQGVVDEWSQKGWCAMFICDRYRQVLGQAPWGDDKRGTGEIVNWGIKNKIYSDRRELEANGYKDIKPGDIMNFYGERDGKTVNHVALVESIDYEKGTITTIDGNSWYGQVRRNVHKMSDMPTLDGIVRMNDYMKNRGNS